MPADEKKVEDSGRFTRGLGGGIVAGMIGGAVLSLLMVIMTVSQGGDAWGALKGSGAPFTGQRAMQPGFDAGAVAIGLAVHFLVSVTWGAAFGVLAYGLSRGATIAAGFIWGVVIWTGMFYVLLPAAGLGQVAEAAPKAPALVTHLVFGGVMGFAFLPFQPYRRARRVESARRNDDLPDLPPLNPSI